MGEDIAVSLKNISKCFKRYNRPVDRLQELILPGKSRAEEFWALKDINLQIPKGETVGIIGRNGSGKSTMLQIVAGTLTPTTGEINVKGRVSALLELGSGFNPEFTGRQNVFFNGRLLGLTREEIEEKFDAIAGFADIGDFMEQPVKTYSSGMFVRLAFAVAVNVDPEVLIVDEALAVGDVVFQHRCMRRMRNLMDSGVTTLFVSHDSGAIKTLCNSAVMIHEGEIYTSGLPNNVIIDYLKMVTDIELGSSTLEVEDVITHDKQKQPLLDNLEDELDCDRGNHQNINHKTNKLVRRGSGKALIETIELLNHLGESDGESPIFAFNEEVKLIVKVKAYQELKSCMVGFYICDKNGNEIIGTNTLEEKLQIESLGKNSEIQVEFQFKLPLRSGSYSLTVAVAENYQSLTLDWLDNAIVFQVLPPDTGKQVHALIDHPIEVNLNQTQLSEIILER